MPHGLRFFNRQFLANPEDPRTDTAVIVRVSQTGSDFMSAGFTLMNGEERMSLMLHANTEEELNDALRQASMLAEVAVNFAKAVKAEAKEVRREMQRTAKEAERLKQQQETLES